MVGMLPVVFKIAILLSFSYIPISVGNISNAYTTHARLCMSCQLCNSSQLCIPTATVISIAFLVSLLEVSICISRPYHEPWYVFQNSGQAIDSYFVFLSFADNHTNCCHLLSKLLGNSLLAHSSLGRSTVLSLTSLDSSSKLVSESLVSDRLICFCGQVSFI